MAKKLLTIFAAVLLLVCAADYPRLGPRSASSGNPTIELADGWHMIEAAGVADPATISTAGYDTAGWIRVPRMPGTVLQILQQAGVYPDLYYGTNLRTEVPQDLYKKDWWYRTTFTAPAGRQTYLLNFPGINYRADIWLNGHRVADKRQIVGMYTDHELDVTPWIASGRPNTLAVKVTPERAIQDLDGVELADSWYDWINWRYLGYPNPDGETGTSFVPDRNAGIWKPVSLRAFGPVGIGSATVKSELPDGGGARLTLYAGVRNYTGSPVRGVLNATITRSGRETIRVAEPVVLESGESREVTFSPDEFAQLTVGNPDLWWPYTMGDPALYDMRLDFIQNRSITSTSTSRFGIRTVTGERDPVSGDFYLRVNGRDMLVRGATYTPDLLYRYDPDRDRSILGYVKDLGLNLIRLESKIASTRFTEMADEMGIPLMYGWMCCNQWEKWPQWDAEDHRVARESLRSQIRALRSHPSVFIWANASDGRPPEAVLSAYRQILTDLHWPNAVVDTVSSFARDADGRRLWDGIEMAGPYAWRPPSYWFADRYRAARGSSAEQGDNEHIPPYASLRTFIPQDRLWPINETWYFHAGSNPQNSTLTNIRRVVDQRYGPSTDARMFADKAQLAHYEATRAQFESFAAGGWDSHKMTVYWMLNSHWPSFFGNIFDYYLRPGGAYFGAKKGLRPLSAVFDSYATGDHRQGVVTVVNQGPRAATSLRVRVRTYDLTGRVRDDRSAVDVSVDAGGSARAVVLPPGPADSPVFFVRAQLFDAGGGVLNDNVYWQSQQPDDLGPPSNDSAFDSKQVSWADMTSLNTLPPVAPEVSATRDPEDPAAATVRLRNPTGGIAFFQRVELLAAADGDEILPATYDDNYVTVFPGETVEIRGRAPAGGPTPRWVRATGFNGPAVVVAMR